MTEWDAQIWEINKFLNESSKHCMTIAPDISTDRPNFKANPHSNKYKKKKSTYSKLKHGPSLNKEQTGYNSLCKNLLDYLDKPIKKYPASGNGKLNIFD